MTNFQCSMCLATYSFDDYMKLKSDWIDKKNKEKYGKKTFCKCGTAFHEKRWTIQTRKDMYVISTVHLEMGSMSTIDYLDMSNDYFYETMIFKVEGEKFPLKYKPLDFQMRYKTREEAIQGHIDTIEKLEFILLDPEKYPMGVLARFSNLMMAVSDQQKTIRPSVKERLV